MVHNSIDQGETIVLRAVFKDDAGEPASPSTPVEVTIRTPDDSVNGPHTASEAETGVFEYEYQVASPGGHVYKVETADGAVEQGTFYGVPDFVES